MFRRPRFVFSFGVSRGPIGLSFFGLGIFLCSVSIVIVPMSERDLVLVIDLEAFCASVGFVSVLGVGAFLFSECDY